MSFLEWMGLFYVASMLTMGGAVACEKVRKWYVNELRAREYYRLRQAYPASQYYDTVSTRRWR